MSRVYVCVLLLVSVWRCLGSAQTQIQDCIEACAPLRFFPTIVTFPDPSCPDREALARALIQCNHDCYAALGGITDGSFSNLPACTAANQSGVYTCSVDQLCDAIASQYGSPFGLEYSNPPTPSPTSSPVTPAPTESPVIPARRLNEARRLAEQNILKLKETRGRGRNLAPESSNPGSILETGFFEGVFFGPDVSKYKYHPTGSVSFA